jgi:hypothetical protein
MGVRYLVTTDDPPWPPRPNGRPRVPGLELVERAGPVLVFEVPGALPRDFTAGEAVVAGDREALSRLGRSRFPIARRVVLHDPDAARHPAAPAGRKRLEVLDQRPGRVLLAVERDAPGWLVALLTRFPGWRATVDGRPAPLYRANVAFTAVPVPAGRHRVELDYRPASVRWGLAISGISLVLLAALGAAAGFGWGLRRGTPAGSAGSSAPAAPR